MFSVDPSPSKGKVARRRRTGGGGGKEQSPCPTPLRPSLQGRKNDGTLNTYQKYLACLAAALTIATADVGCGPNTLHTPLHIDSSEIIALKMAASGKRPDGSPMKEGEPGYISPQDAQKRLEQVLRKPLASNTGTANDDKEKPGAGKTVSPPVVDLSRSAPITVSVTDANGKPASFLLRITASGMDLLPGVFSIGEYHHGTYKGHVPEGLVEVEVSGGWFRNSVVRRVAAKAGHPLHLKIALGDGFASRIRQAGYAPCRLVYLGGQGQGWSPEPGDQSAESGLKPQASGLRTIEAVWQADIIATDQPGDAGERFRGALMPPWPGFGKNLLIGDQNLEPLLAAWRLSIGSKPNGVFLSNPSVLWTAQVCSDAEGRYVSPRSAFLLWSGLRETLPNAGLFEEALPAELPMLYAARLTRAVCVPPSRAGVELYARLRAIYPDLLPAPPVPVPGEAFPDILLWGSPKTPQERLIALRNGAYTLARGLYITATLDGKPPGRQSEFASGARLNFKISVLTAALPDATIDEVLIYKDGKLVHREAGQPNQTQMHLAFPVTAEGPASYWAAALGHVESAPRTLAAPSAAPSRKFALFAITSVFHIGAPQTGQPQITIPIVVRSPLGAALPGLRIKSGESDATTDRNGEARIPWDPAAGVAIEHSGKHLAVDVFGRERLLRLYEAAHSGVVDWATEAYFNRVVSVVTNEPLEVVLDDGRRGAAEGAKKGRYPTW